MPAREDDERVATPEDHHRVAEARMVLNGAAAMCAGLVLIAAAFFQAPGTAFRWLINHLGADVAGHAWTDPSLFGTALVILGVVFLVQVRPEARRGQDARIASGLDLAAAFVAGLAMVLWVSALGSGHEVAGSPFQDVDEPREGWSIQWPWVEHAGFVLAAALLPAAAWLRGTDANATRRYGLTAALAWLLALTLHPAAPIISLGAVGAWLLSAPVRTTGHNVGALIAVPTNLAWLLSLPMDLGSSSLLARSAKSSPDNGSLRKSGRASPRPLPLPPPRQGHPWCREQSAPATPGPHT